MKAELKKKLGSLGVEVPVNPDGEVPKEYPEELKAFLGGFDFMKLGQAVNRQQWESAMMTVRRMDQRCDMLGLVCFKRSFAGIRQAVVRKDVHQAKQLLSSVVQRRVRLLEVLQMSRSISSRTPSSQDFMASMVFENSSSSSQPSISAP